MQYKIISSQKDFLKIAEIWKIKYLTSDNYSFFQSYEWNYYWYLNNLIDKKLFVVLFYKENYKHECNLICPTFIDEKGALRFISDNHSDFCDVLTNNILATDCTAISKLFSELILNHSEIKKVNFKNFSRNNSYISILLSDIEFNSKYFETASSSSFILEKEKQFPYSVSHFKASNRKRIRKNIKKFLNYEYKLVNSNNLEFPIKILVRLRDYMLKKGSRDIDFLNDDMIKTINDLYDNHLIDISMVSYKNEVKSIIIIFKKQNSYQLWISLYMEIPHISVFTINSFLKSISSKKDIRIDLGRGLYRFKIMNYAPTILPLYEFYFSKNNLDYFIFIFIKILKTTLKKLLK